MFSREHLTPAVRAYLCDEMAPLEGRLDLAHRATAARLTYYARAGYTDLRVVEDERGVLVTSREGLRSFAYREHHLLGLFGRAGYALERRFELADPGAGLLLCPEGS